MRFTLTYTPQAKAELARLWLASKDRHGVTQSADRIEHMLGNDPDLKGDVVSGSLRKIVEWPLVYYFIVSPDDRLATVWSVRIAGPEPSPP